MRILLIGASGTIGGGITKALAGHELLTAGRTSGAHQVDITNQESIAALFKAVGQVDAVVCAAGAAKFAPLDQLAFEDYRFSIHGKLMSQSEINYEKISDIWVPVKNLSNVTTPAGQMKVEMEFSNVKVNKGIGDEEFKIE